MSFGQLLLHSQVWPFTLLLGLFLAAALLEIFMVFSGLGSDLGLDLSADIEVPDVTNAGGMLDWLGIGRVPFLITVAAFLLCAGSIGLFVQTLQLELLGVSLPWPFAMIGTLIVSVLPVRMLNHGLGRLWPKDVETSVVSAESHIGHEARLVLGKITADEPGQIKFRDTGGANHHAMAYADRSGETYEQDDALLIVGRRGAFYTVIRHPNPSRPATTTP